MGTLSILFIIKIMINSEIFLTHKSKYRFSQQDEIQKSNLNGEETKFHKWNHKCFSSNNLVTYPLFYCKLQYSVVVKIVLMQNLIDNKNPLLVRFDMVKSVTVTLNFSVFLLESVSSSNLYCKKFGKLKIFCLKLYLESLFLSRHLHQKFFKFVFFNSEETITDWSWLLNRS